jgi:hypothetical protein
MGQVSTLGKRLMTHQVPYQGVQGGRMTGQLTRRGIAVRAPESEATPVAGIADPVAWDVAKWAANQGVVPIAMSAFSLGFGIIAAAWLTGISIRAEGTAFIALLASYITGRAGRLMDGQDVSPVTKWGRAACAVLVEVVVYAGIAGGASANAAASAGTGLTGPIGESLRRTSLASFGGAGPGGVWRLATVAMILLALRQTAALCVAATPGRVVRFPRLRRLQVLIGLPGRERLVVIGLAVMLAGARATFALLIAVSLLALLLVLTARTRDVAQRGNPAEAGDWIGRYRGDGPLSVWIGGWVDGRLPPIPPLIVGLLVTGVLTVLGLENLPGILVFAPAEAMLLAALASWHPHDRPQDWLVPTLLQAGEYVFLAALGFTGRVQPPVTFALITAVAMRHLDLGYRARNRLSPARFVLPRGVGQPPPRLPGADWRGLGWEGRMLVMALAAAAGFLPAAYAAGAVYLWGLLGWDFLAGWSA